MYLRKNQDKIRAECYQNVCDALSQSDFQADDVGKQIILPVTHIGSPHYMCNLFHESMTMVQVFGKPDLFIKMTCNPKWNKLTTAIGPSAKASDHPNLVARIFILN